MTQSSTIFEEWHWRDRYLGWDENFTSLEGEFMVPNEFENGVVWVSPSRPTIFKADTNYVFGNRFHDWEEWDSIENFHSFDFSIQDSDENGYKKLTGVYKEVFSVTINSNYSIPNSIQFFDPWRYEDSGTPLAL